MNLEEYLNTPVTLYGIAENSMAGAVLVCGPDSHVFIDGLAEWSEDEKLRAIELDGLLVREGDDADLEPDEAGIVSHGIGSHYVVKEATWEVIP
ncbi:hypothetical protein [Nocardia wallacei]|uniref:hypothetical protein n=1 Tax=Nocardia wallacei TaxID=480035 RepID=UPI002455CDB4|nr:hypothetical protein [Nocardia wallacei]